MNGRYRLRLEARRSVGLPYGIFPRLILTYLTTQAIRTKSREIDLGRTPNDFGRTLGVTPISGPRGTITRLQDQLNRLCSVRLSWQFTKNLKERESGSGLIVEGDPCLRRLAARLLGRKPNWSSRLVLSHAFFQEIVKSSVPVDLRAVQSLKRSPLATDLYVWLAYRMSYLHRPTVIPWDALRLQFGAAYARSRDFQKSLCTRLRQVVGVYPQVRLRQISSGLRLYPSPPHVRRRQEDSHFKGNRTRGSRQ